MAEIRTYVRPPQTEHRTFDHTLTPNLATMLHRQEKKSVQYPKPSFELPEPWVHPPKPNLEPFEPKKKDRSSNSLRPNTKLNTERRSFFM